MRRFVARVLDADHVPWLYLFAAFMLLEAAAHADSHVRLGVHWFVYFAPVGVAASVLAATAAALQHNKLQMFVITAVLAFIGADTPNPHRFPGIQVSHVLYIVAGVSFVFMLIAANFEWAGTNWLRWRAKRLVPAVMLAAAFTLLVLYRDSLTGAAFCAAAIVGSILWYERLPSEVDYRGERPSLVPR